MEKTSGITAEIKQVPNEPGKPPLMALVIQDGVKYATRITLSVKQRAQLAGQLLRSLRAVAPMPHGEAFETAQTALVDFLESIKQGEDEKAHLPAMSRAKYLGATDKEMARDVVNYCTNRRQGDRSPMTTEEWKEADRRLANLERSQVAHITTGKAAPIQEQYSPERMQHDKEAGEFLAHIDGADTEVQG